MDEKDIRSITYNLQDDNTWGKDLISSRLARDCSYNYLFKSTDVHITFNGPINLIYRSQYSKLGTTVDLVIDKRFGTTLLTKYGILYQTCPKSSKFPGGKIYSPINDEWIGVVDKSNVILYASHESSRIINSLQRKDYIKLEDIVESQEIHIKKLESMLDQQKKDYDKKLKEIDAKILHLAQIEKDKTELLQIVDNVKK